MNEVVNYLCDNRIKIYPRKAGCGDTKWNELGEDHVQRQVSIQTVLGDKAKYGPVIKMKGYELS
jgi:hypothetical protein